MGLTEHRVARSIDGDSHVNTLDVYPGPKFAILELLDSKDSVYVRKYLNKRGWSEVTPDAHRKQKTFYGVRPTPADINAFVDIKPDWFYISGHYARTGRKLPKVNLFCLPAGFFNEPFHVAEWETAWGETSAKTFFLQCEALGGKVLEDYLNKMYEHWFRSPYGPDGTTVDDSQMVDVIFEWSEVWEKPKEDLKVHTTRVPGMRGLLCTNVWSSVKMVLLCGCNTHTWLKTAFHKAFPNAIVLGYIGKNPANAVPHISAFMKLVYKGISDPSDPKLMDHDHLAGAWVDVYRKRRLGKSDRMVYMLPDGNTFGVEEGTKNIVKAGRHDQVISRHGNIFKENGNSFAVPR